MAQPDLSQGQPAPTVQHAAVIRSYPQRGSTLSTFAPAAQSSLPPSYPTPARPAPAAQQAPVIGSSPAFLSPAPTSAYAASISLPPSFPVLAPTYADDWAPILAKQPTLSRNRAGVLALGVLMLLMLVVIPIWDAILLLTDQTFVFWIGRTLPAWIIVSCLLLVFLYAVTSILFFRFGNKEYQTEQTVMMIASIFVTLLGFAMLLLAVPLMSQTSVMYTNLREHCDTSAATVTLFEYYVVLNKIRQTPNCTAQVSVKSCQTEGYQDALPYTAFLEAIESDLKCTGFCYNKIAGPVGSGSVTYPPALFSNATYQNSCEGAMSRRLQLLAADAAHTLFYLGLLFLGVAIGVGLLELVGFCMSAPEGERRALMAKSMPPYSATEQSWPVASPTYSSMPTYAAT